MQEIIKKAVELLQNKFKLPSDGFLAGGALANTINKLKWGGKCVINDIDIFIVDEIKEYDKKEHIEKRIPDSYTTKKLYSTYKVDTYTDRLFISKVDKGDDYITIKKSLREGIFNKIHFDANKVDYLMFLETFDINCTQVGYDLKNKKAYWTNDFEEFVNTKELKITLPNTPSHTALRILKKRDELEATLNKKAEFQFLTFCNLQKIKGRKKVWFGDTYLPIYIKYKEELSEYFDLHTQIGQNIKPTISEKRIIYKKESNETFPLYRLLPKEWEFGAEPEKYQNLIIDSITLDEYTNYWRNIKPDTNKKLIWKYMQQFYNKESYLDNFPIENATEYEYEFILIKNLVKKYPFLLKWLEDKTLIEQFEYVKNLTEICDESPELYNVLNHHSKYISFETKDELKEKLHIFKIRYRKQIYADKQTPLLFSDL